MNSDCRSDADGAPDDELEDEVPVEGVPLRLARVPDEIVEVLLMFSSVTP
jgi:hypothetical protein